jgi:hypothetical protein
MAYFYTSKSDANLVKQLLAGCAELYVRKKEFSGTVKYNSVAGTDDEFQLISGTAVANDAYNNTVGFNFYCEDDNGALAYGTVIDTIGGTGDPVVVVDTTAMKLVSDGTTAPTFTDGTSYNGKVLSAAANTYGDYFGYTDDSVEFDNTPETEVLEICNIDGQLEEKDEVVTKANVMLSGATFNVPNSDVISKIMNATSYGLNDATQNEYHGGFSPDISTRYELTALTKDRQGKEMAIQLFDGQFKLNGALALSGTGFKSISFEFKGKADSLRDSNAVNAYRIIISL